MPVQEIFDEAQWVIGVLEEVAYNLKVLRELDNFKANYPIFGRCATAFVLFNLNGGIVSNNSQYYVYVVTFITHDTFHVIRLEQADHQLDWYEARAIAGDLFREWF